MNSLKLDDFAIGKEIMCAYLVNPSMAKDLVKKYANDGSSIYHVAVNLIERGMVKEICYSDGVLHYLINKISS